MYYYFPNFSLYIKGSIRRAKFNNSEKNKEKSKKVHEKSEYLQ